MNLYFNSSESEKDKQSKIHYMTHDVFISYSSKNKTAADAICHVLENNGIKCWMAPRDIPAGSRYGDMIDDAIKFSSVVVVIFSQTAAESEWVNGELNVAFEEQKTIIPFRIDSTPLTGQNRVMLNQKHWIDAYPDYEEKFSDLVNAVLLVIGKKVDTKSNSAKEREPRRPIKNNTKIKLFSLISIIAIGIGIIIYMIYKYNSETFKYNKNGLKVESLRGLTKTQQDVLTSILDNMVLVEGGSFLMGNDYTNPDYLTELDSLSRNPHTVNLSNFYISKYEVTQSQWKAFNNLKDCYIELGDSKAIDNTSWEEANDFAKKLSQLTGLRFSLPTEAQWEYAAKEGKQNVGNIFSGCNDKLHHYAWTQADNLNSAADVGNRLPNKLGLYDMTGNVGEWCLDNYQDYTSDMQTNPIMDKGMYKIYRGGDYTTPNMIDMKTTSRYYAPPFSKREATGVRLVIN